MDSGLSDCQLVVQAQGGCNKAYSELIRRYKPLLGYKAKIFFLIGAEKDDVFQEALIGFYKAIRDYRNGEQSSFKSFSEFCVNRQVISAVRRACRHKHKPLYKYKRLPNTGSITIKSSDPLEKLMLKEWLGKLELRLKALSITERQVFFLYNQGLSYKEIAESVKVSKKQVDNILQRVRAKLKKIIKDIKDD